MFKRIEEWALSLLQKRCKHPGMMVAVDILEGSGHGIEVMYCNRCGAIRLKWSRPDSQGRVMVSDWRCPDPILWRG